MLTIKLRELYSFKFLLIVKHIVILLNIKKVMKYQLRYRETFSRS
jgi:hypothetical protein